MTKSRSIDFAWAGVAAGWTGLVCLVVGCRFGAGDELGGDAVLVMKEGFLFGGGWLWSVLGHESYGVRVWGFRVDRMLHIGYNIDARHQRTLMRK